MVPDKRYLYQSRLAMPHNAGSRRRRGGDGAAGTEVGDRVGGRGRRGRFAGAVSAGAAGGRAPAAARAMAAADGAIGAGGGRGAGGAGGGGPALDRVVSGRWSGRGERPQRRRGGGESRG